MGMIGEFKEFALKGNMVDMAIGIIIGGAFGTIVKSLVDDVLMPPLGKLMGGVDFAEKAYSLNSFEFVSTKTADKADVLLKYGAFFNSIIAFVIVAFALFMLVKAMNKAKAAMEKEAQKEEAAAEPPAQEKLLMEIRDLLKK